MSTHYMIKMDLRAKAKLLEPIIRVGKNGLTDSMIEEINKVLKKYKLIKIKFLKGALADKKKKELFLEVAEKTGSKLVDAVGFVVVLYKE